MRVMEVRVFSNAMSPAEIKLAQNRYSNIYLPN